MIKRPLENDVQLIKAFQAGDRSAFDTLVQNHQDRVFNVSYWMMGDYQEADDCAQETFIKVFRSVHRFRFDAAFSTWLFRIAVNTCKNRLKSSGTRWKKRSVSLQDPGASEAAGPDGSMADGSDSPLAALEKKERIMRVRQAIQALPGNWKQVVVLRDIEGLSYEEIGDITGLNPGTVKSRLARARNELKSRLKGSL